MPVITVQILAIIFSIICSYRATTKTATKFDTIVYTIFCIAFLFICLIAKEVVPC
jgi:hypothetical protein